MAVPIRQADPDNIVAGSRTFFITSSLAAKRNLLQSERSAGLFIDVLYHYRFAGKYLLHAFVVMPDHFHALITVGANLSIERAVQFIKGGFAFRAGKELGFKPPVWQRGFSEVRVCEYEAFDGFREYIEANPVKRGLVQALVEFPYSSASGAFEIDGTPQGLKPAILRGNVRHA
jgi:putative transposase